MDLHARLARTRDAAAIADIYNQGIADRIATFDTVLRTEADIRAWFDRRHPIVVVTDGDQPDAPVLGFAATSTYRPRECYAGVAEFSVYVAREARGRGVGRTAMTLLAAEAASAGIWKLVTRIFTENEASRRLMMSAGFREVGVYRRHAKLDGVWRDTVIVELLLGEAAEPE